MSSLHEDLRAIRGGVAYRPQIHGMLRLCGEDAHEAAEELSPRDVHVLTGQILHSLVLSESGLLRGDLYVIPEGENMLLLADGMTGPDLAGCLQPRLGTLDAKIEVLDASHALMSFAGPYAWEALSRALGDDLLTLPQMCQISLRDHGGIQVLRKGNTGEYGYELFGPRELVEATTRRILDGCEDLEPREVSLEAYDVAALESGCFCPRHAGVLEHSPVEMQLQWRVAYDREYHGSAGLLRRREAASRRVAWFIGRPGDALARANAAITREGRPIGTVLTALQSPTLGCPIGLAMIDREWSAPWLEGLFVEGSGGEPVELRTEAPPLVQSRSLFVDPAKHVFASRLEDEFPPIVPGAEGS